MIVAWVCGIGLGVEDFAFLQRELGYSVVMKEPGVDGVEHKVNSYLLEGSGVEEGEGEGKA
jgi:hypothetical protein